jgi:glycosyltransferase involved in cell wall biosynthesis
MFICQIVASRGNGGLEKHVRELTSCLAEKGHRVFVIADRQFIKTLPAGVEHKAINMRMSRYNPWLLLQLFFIFKKNKFDIVHAQADKAASVVSFVNKLLKISAVATVHNIKKRYRVYDGFDNVISVSKFIGSQLTNANANVHVHVVYNGIQPPSNVDVDLKSTFNLPNKPVICAVGRLVHAKGFDLLIKAVDGLNVNLVIAGTGPQHAVLQQSIAKLHADTHVLLLGHQTDITPIMRGADCVVIASRREGFSYVLNEALLCEKRILSTDVPVANEVLCKDLIVPTENVEALRAKIVELLDNVSYWDQCMEKAYAFSKNKMTLPLMTENIISIYKNILNT